MVTATWTNTTGNGDLNNPKNWSSGAVPGKNDTALFTANTTVHERYSGAFTPGLVQIADNTLVQFSDSTVYHFTTLETDFGSTVSFVNSAMEASTVDAYGQLDLSKAGVIYYGGNSLPPSWKFSDMAGTYWSENHGFGAMPFSGIIQKFITENTQISSSPIPPDFMQGSFSLGANNVAIYNLIDTMPHGGDSSSYFTSQPTSYNGGQFYDTSLLQVGPAYDPNNLPGYDPSGTAYITVLSGRAF